MTVRRDRAETVVLTTCRKALKEKIIYETIFCIVKLL
jgi:hypothetical protein